MARDEKIVNGIDGLKLFIHEYVETSNNLSEVELIKMVENLNNYTDELNKSSSLFTSTIHELKCFLFQLQCKLEAEIAAKKSLVSPGDLISYFVDDILLYAIVEEVFYFELNETFKDKKLYLKIYEIGTNGKMKTRNTIIPYVISEKDNLPWQICWIVKFSKENMIVKNYNRLAIEMNSRIDSFSSLPGIVNYPFE